MYLKEGIQHINKMKDRLETCKNCIFSKDKCDNPESMYYDLEVAPNSTCSEWESKMKFE